MNTVPSAKPGVTLEGVAGSDMRVRPKLRPPSRWHDPLRLIQEEAPSQVGRVVLCSISGFVLALVGWAAYGQLDIIATASGKLVPQTLVKIVQPAEPGVVRELLAKEGDTVKAGQVLARLDPTIVIADKESISADLTLQKMHVRRIQAELAERSMTRKSGDDQAIYAQVENQSLSHRRAYLDAVDQEASLLAKAEHERQSAEEILKKLEQTVPTYQKTSDAYAKLEKEGFIGSIAAAQKNAEMIEKMKDIDAQRSTVSALRSTTSAQQKKISQLKNSYKSDLQKELTDVLSKVAQLQPALQKTTYRESLMELKAPQDGVIKDLATTTVGAVVQPGTVVMTLVPKDERLFADVNIQNEDAGFVRVGQPVQIKLAAYRFQRHGLLGGKVVHISADATDAATPGSSAAQGGASSPLSAGGNSTPSFFKARVQLDRQSLRDPSGTDLQISPGMQITAEINYGKRTVLEYLIDPVQKAIREAGREK